MGRLEGMRGLRRLHSFDSGSALQRNEVFGDTKAEEASRGEVRAACAKGENR